MAAKTCKVDGCDVKHWANGFCSRHNSQVQRHGAIQPDRPPVPGACTADGCNAKYYAKGSCNRHYIQVRKHGAVQPDQLPALEGLKRCPKCGETKTLDEFHHRGRNGRVGRCKVCVAKRDAEHYAANREKRAAQYAAWYADHYAEYYTKNVGAIRLGQRSGRWRRRAAAALLRIQERKSA